MEFIKAAFAAEEQDTRDIITALLSDAGYEGFEETAGGLLAYTDAGKFDEGALKTVADTTETTYTIENVPQQNWNALWESNFPPVVVDGFCTVRAGFHQINIDTPYEIIITPKMSFGTGHHATTRLMMTLMKEVSFTGKVVLDFGTGTGVLAILAEKMGAAHVLAIDNDEWSVENANENIGRNSCSKIKVSNGSLENVDETGFDVILANINRNIILEYISYMYDKLREKGTLLMSGLLSEDEPVITQAADRAGFKVHKSVSEAGWIAIVLYKI